MADKKTSKKILVTSALPYANGAIHIGHLVEYIQTDIFVRFLKLIGEDAIYCCADDTHGTPIEVNAKKQGITPEELIAKFYKEHVNDFSRFHIRFDSYYSTNSKENKHYADLIFNRLKEKGHIYTKDVEQTYCEHCQRFLPDRFVKGKCPNCGAEDQYGDVCEKCNTAYTTTELVEPYCTICKNPPVRKSSTHYFFRLSDFSDKLKNYIQQNKNMQDEIKNYVFDWIQKGLKDWDISRDGPYFGFKIPGEENKYYYVWLDAPVGYISSTKNYCDQHNKNIDDYWHSEDSRIMHFIGKDIIYFHFLFWPAMLMGSGFNVPDDIVVHGFLTVNGEKMSKSRGTFLTASEFAEMYEPEMLRFYYAKTLSKKLSDIDLNFKDFVDSVNNELIANIGNFTYRALSFTAANFQGKIKGLDAQGELQQHILELAADIKENYHNLNYKEAIKLILQVSSLGNKYFQEQKPWALVKEDKDKAQQVLATSINIVKILAVLCKPILPHFTQQLESQLNLHNLTWHDINFDTINHTLAAPSIILNKLELKEQETFPLSLKVAEVKEVDDIEGADKLYHMTIDTGERRSLVAGLKQYYTKEQLLGSKLIVITNLKPAKLRGIESQGMLLAAEKDGKVSILTADDKAGTEVKLEGIKNSSAIIDYKEFQKLKFDVKGKKVFYKGKQLKTEKKEVTVDIEDGAKVC